LPYDGRGMTANDRPRWRRALRASYLIVCNTLLLLLAAEAGFRACTSGTGALRSARGVERVAYAVHPFLQATNPPGPGVDPGPDLAGWRIDPADAAAAPDRTRILFLGGATTDYPRVVRAALEPTLGPVTVYDLAAPGHTSLHSLYKFWTYVDEIRPELVVVQHNVEDFARGFTPPRLSLPEYRSDYSHYAGPLSPFWTPTEARYDGRPVFLARPVPGATGRYAAGDDSVLGMLRDLAQASDLARAVREQIGARRLEKLQDALGLRDLAQEEQHEIMFADQVLRSLPAFERNMKNLRHGCRTKQVRALFLTMPFQVATPKKSYLLPARRMTNDDRQHMLPDDFEFGMRKFNEAVLALAAPKFTYVLDLAGEITDPAAFVDEVHLSEAGQRLQGERVARFVLEQGLLPLPH